MIELFPDCDFYADYLFKIYLQDVTSKIIAVVELCFPIVISMQIFCLFVFVALRPMSTAMVIAGRSVHLTTLFPGQA